MKASPFTTSAALVCVLSGICVTLPLSAQTYDVVAVEKFSDFTQTDTNITAAAATPFGFAIFVEGTGLSGITAPTFTSPAGSGTTGGTLTYDAEDDQWAHDIGLASQGVLNSEYQDGEYTVNVAGTSLVLDLSGNAYPNTPLLSFSQGFWSGGVFFFDPGQSLVITTNAFSTYAANVEGLISLNTFTTSGPGYTNELDQFYSMAPGSDTLSITINAFDINGGQSLELEAGFTAVVDLITDGALPDAKLVAIYSTFTNLQLRAVPEAANSAWLAGAGVLALTLARRRNRR